MRPTVEVTVRSRRERRFLPEEGVVTRADPGPARSDTTSGAPISRSSNKRKQKSNGDSAGLRFSPAANTSSALGFDIDEAITHLGRKDATMRKLIEKVGPFRLELDEMLTVFETLAESIVYQQLTGKAAATIFSRVKAIYGKPRLPAAKIIMKTPDAELRGAGLSTAKTLAFKDLAERQHKGLIPSLEELNGMEDEVIVETLSQVRGIGRWTVEMLLMFRLGRPDVLPIHDYGVRKGFAATYGYSSGTLPTPKELYAFGEKWRPYRSVASWYLWRALELPENAKLK